MKIKEKNEEIIKQIIETITIDNGLDQELYEDRLRDILSEMFQIQEEIKKAVNDKSNKPNYLWEDLEKIRKLQNKIDLIVEALKRISKQKRN